MDHNQNDINDALILAYLRGENLSEKDHESIEKWLSEPENQAKARELFQTWELSLLASSKRTDVDAAFQKVSNQLAHEPTAKEVKLKNIWWYAAASILIIAVSIFLYSRNEKSIPEQKAQLTALETNTDYTLEDESSVSLKKGALLTYQPKSFNSGTERIVNLEGEAFFEVAHNPERPFIIKANNAEIKVLGTKFLVKTYNDQPTQVLVTEGKVQVTYKSTGDIIILEAEEEVVVQKDQAPIVKSSDVNQLYWKTGVMRFQNESLSKVFQTLSSEFGKQIIVENDDINQCKITATFKKQSLGTIIKVIESTHQLESSISGDSITIKGHGCN
ncbi:FecR domain-containing protein [Fulvivirga maritima]|uniref:FecR family protein n=1 Tax=Fulvivirga maritima TaxID=2904247 RepID=UPI001F167A5A|nr:FecR domain-containing protein [Fulvivirga maritima]UII27398.1 FecR domain-containing protein [Fulvivirga maritima]